MAKARSSQFFVRWHVFLSALIAIGLVGGVFSWSAAAKLSSAVIAQGTVIVGSKPKQVAHMDGGVVRAIHVEEGDFVAEGDILIELDQTQTKAELGVIEAELLELTARAARLAAVADGDAEVAFPDGFEERSIEAADIAAAERKLFRSIRSHADSVRRQLVLQVEQLETEIEGLTGQLDAKVRQGEFVTLELEQARTLYEDRLARVDRVYALEREAARMEGDIRGVEADIARARGRISEIEVEISTMDRSARLDARREMRAAEARMTELEERRVAAKDRLDRSVIRAPVAGYVHELSVNTIGGVVTAAETILALVPHGDALRIEARIAPSDGDQVAVGGEANLRFSAFDQQHSPELTGRIAVMSADISNDAATGQQYYVALIELDDRMLVELGDFEVTPGMPVEVFVATGERTALSYIVKPIADHFERAWRE